MRTFATYYYLLFVLLIMGAFASMAQNDYGVKILGGVAMAFSILFLIQLMLWIASKEKYGAIVLIELGSLVLLSMILGMRVFYIHFTFVEVIFGFAGLMLIFSYAAKSFQSWMELKNKNRMMAILMSFLYGSIILYTLSMTVVPFTPAVAEPAGGMAFALFIIFVLSGYYKKELLVDGEKLSLFQFAGRLKDRSVVLLALFLIFTAYMGLTKFNLLPRMYSDEFPQAYFELVKQAESGMEKPVNGKYKHEEFKEMYDQFVSRNNVADQK